MKYQQVSVDFVNMVFTAFTYVALAGAVWVFLRLLQACFWLPKHLKKQNDISDMLQDKVNSYERYIEECEAKEKAASESGETLVTVDENGEEKRIPPVIDEAKWKERRECLEMLKKELKRVKDGGDMYDWDHLLEDDEEDDNNEKDEKNEKTERNDEETFSDVDDETKCNSKARLNAKIEDKEVEECPIEGISEENKKNN